MVRAAGYEPTIVHTYTDARDALIATATLPRAERFALIVTDYDLPDGCGGNVVLRAFGRLARTVGGIVPRVVVVTGNPYDARNHPAVRKYRVPVVHKGANTDLRAAIRAT